MLKIRFLTTSILLLTLLAPFFSTADNWAIKLSADRNTLFLSQEVGGEEIVYTFFPLLNTFQLSIQGKAAICSLMFDLSVDVEDTGKWARTDICDVVMVLKTTLDFDTSKVTFSVDSNDSVILSSRFDWLDYFFKQLTKMENKPLALIPPEGLLERVKALFQRQSRASTPLPFLDSRLAQH